MRNEGEGRKKEKVCDVWEKTVLQYSPSLTGSGWPAAHAQTHQCILVRLGKCSGTV